ncbi:shikimate dehydrogenase family protein [Desulfonema magnum]|uniref:Shikimate dehydrogenase n=1 Tax=Desulfonema magnum TaxID=45655 RepID=A0A975GNX7_9BACT|nr:shikimate dehydrogenase [Desulfonema magnum]QTA87328.1 Shikimate dehydrogenase [Desulfonema magnum]
MTNTQVSSKVKIKTNVFCILGDERIFHSKSPDMFSAVMRQVGMKGGYVPFMVRPGMIGEAMRSLSVLNIAGANVTVPYKEAVIPHMDELSEGATIIGSVNTIVPSGGKLKGYNTNAIGFMDALGEAGFDVAGRSAIVFGTGGAARSVVFILNWLHAGSIFITGRSQDKTRSIVNRIGGEAHLLESLPKKSVPANILVNATSVSGYDEAPELADLIQKLELPVCELVVDLNYGRSENFWQDMARKRGIRFMDGLSCLANQARRTLALWTGVDVKAENFLKALK